MDAVKSNNSEPAIVRQGDVLLVPCAEVPASAKPMEPENGNAVLAHGEVTGHFHSIIWGQATMYHDAALARTYLNVAPGSPVSLTHDEHDTIAIPPGTFEVIRQVEYDLQEGARRVAD